MSKILVLYNYNYYYNRKIKRLSSFQEYVNLITPVGNTPAAYNGFIRENTNFDMQDGVSARHIFNIAKTDPQYAKIDQPNYCVLEETYGEGTSATKKISRWFVIDANRVRGNQWDLTLKRDVLADFYDKVLAAPVFIERGNISDPDNPLLFNKEDISFNQIKKAEFLLNKVKNSGKGYGWVVGYLAREETPTDIGECVAETIAPVESATAFSSLPQGLQDAITSGYYDLYEENDISVSFYGFKAYSTNPNNMGGVITIGQNSYQRLYFPYPALQSNFEGSYFAIESGTTVNDGSDFITYGYQANFGNITNDIKNLLAADPNYNPSITDWRTTYQGTVILKDGKYYELQIIFDSNMPFQKNCNLFDGPNQYPSLHSHISSYLDAVCTGSSHFTKRTLTTAQSQKRCYTYEVSASRFRVELVEVAYGQTKVTLSAHRNQNYEAPYDIFCIPYGTVLVKNNNVLQFTTLQNIALSVARAIAVKGTSAKVYDIQILPYCPFEEILNNDGDIDIAGFTVNYDYDYIKKTVGGETTNVGIVIYPKKAQGTFDIFINSSEEVYDRCVEVVQDPIEKKIAAETTFARFVSPNFASMFDINIQKNKGITAINVDYFLKPYSPYIHVAPYFSGLYGEDFDDPKGLICSGEFSIATASSKWEEYQVQNKNYEQIFNRQIQNIDVNNKLEYKKALWSAVGGGLGGAAIGGGAGAIAGGYLGSVVPGLGTVAGAVVGGVAGAVAGGGISGIGAGYDIKYLKEAQKEARGMFNDMYVYQLGNIQALPYTLTKVSAFTPNNKIFPFIEFYDCTDLEKQALRNKIKYNGATIGVIGKIEDYLGNNNYVQGRLIRLDSIDEASRIVLEIANEIKEGAYFNGDSSE